MCAWRGFTTGDYTGVRNDFGEAFGPHSYPIPEWPNLRFVKTSTVVFGKPSPKCVWAVLNSFFEQTSFFKSLVSDFSYEALKSVPGIYLKLRWGMSNAC